MAHRKRRTAANHRSIAGIATLFNVSGYNYMSLKRRTPSNKQLTGDMVALIDGDIIQYQSACVGDGVSYHWEGHEPFRYKKDAVDYGNANGLAVEDLIKTITPEPVENCLHTAKLMIEGILKATNAGDYRLFLTGKDNYREQIDSRFPYKGHRPTTKPTHFKAVRKYLINTWNAKVVDGMEADDAMGIRQWTNRKHHKELSNLDGLTNTIICTLDKDLDMISGWHYNWQKENMYWVDADEADAFLYQQILTGDSVDNIKGIPGIGPVKAKKLLQNCENNYERYLVCKKAYEEAGMDYYDLLENANLLWIRREENTPWLPPTQ